MHARRCRMVLLLGFVALAQGCGSSLGADSRPEASCDSDSRAITDESRCARVAGDELGAWPHEGAAGTTVTPCGSGFGATQSPTPHQAGSELIYSYIGDGELAAADGILDDVWPVNRSEPVALPSTLTWREDPYGLYAGVEHRRGVLLLARDLVVVVDSLTSATTHRYDQDLAGAP